MGDAVWVCSVQVEASDRSKRHPSKGVLVDLDDEGSKTHKLQAIG